MALIASQCRRALALAPAIYTPANDQVTLTPPGKLTASKPEELIVNGPLVTDALGRAIDGSDDGQSGSDYIATISGSRLTVGGVALARILELPAAVDAVLAQRQLIELTRFERAHGEARLADM